LSASDPSTPRICRLVRRASKSGWVSQVDEIVVDHDRSRLRREVGREEPVVDDDIATHLGDAGPTHLPREVLDPGQRILRCERDLTKHRGFEPVERVERALKPDGSQTTLSASLLAWSVQNPEEAELLSRGRCCRRAMRSSGTTCVVGGRLDAVACSMEVVHVWTRPSLWH
jgi:hypothetical protein